MSLSVVIPTNREHILSLDSLSKQSRTPDEVLVIRGEGLTKNRNKGILQAKGDIIVFLDDDVVLDVDCLKELERLFQFQQMTEMLIPFPNVLRPIGGVSPRVKCADEKPAWMRYLYNMYASVFYLPHEKNGCFQRSGHASYYNRGWDHIRPVEVLYGCCMAFYKKDLLDFMCDENLQGGMFFEDDDLARRMILKRYMHWFTPHAVVTHYPGQRKSVEYRTRCSVRNYLYLHKRNFPNHSKLLMLWSMLGWFLISHKRGFIYGLSDGISQGLL